MTTTVPNADMRYIKNGGCEDEEEKENSEEITEGSETKQ